MPLEIIGAGLPRTGTLSLKTALEELGYPTYHMIENVKYNDSNKWIDVTKVDHGRKFTNWEPIFSPKGRTPYTATVDAPGCTFYKQMLITYPNAKVILSVRDSPRIWVESASETVAAGGWSKYLLIPIFSFFGINFGKMVDAVFFKHPDACNGALYKVSEDGGKSAEEFYSNWVAEVKRSVPADKLLVFNVKEGWEPLCRFLGKPIPDKPFPRVNDRAEFKKRINTMLYSILTVTGLAIAGISLTVMYLMRNGPDLVKLVTAN